MLLKKTLKNTLALSEAETFDDAGEGSTVKYVIDRTKSGLSESEAIPVTRQDGNKVCNAFRSLIDLTELTVSPIGEVSYLNQTKNREIIGLPNPNDFGLSAGEMAENRVVKITAAGDESTKEKSFYFVINFADCSPPS